MPGINIAAADKQDQTSPDAPNHINTPKQQNSPEGDTSDVASTTQDIKKAQVKSISPAREKPHVEGSLKHKVKDTESNKDVSSESKSEQTSSTPQGGVNHDENDGGHAEQVSSQPVTGKRPLMSSTSGGHQGWKRQYREAEESDHEAELYYTKKQRTRTLELSRKGGSNLPV